MTPEEWKELAHTGNFVFQCTPEPELETHLQHVFQRACASKMLTSIGEQLTVLGKERYPGYALLVAPKVLESFLRTRILEKPPLILVSVERFVCQLAYLFAEPVGDLQEFLFGCALVNSSAWVANLVLSTNQPARTVCRQLPGVRDKLLPVFPHLGPVSVSEPEWPAFRDGLASAIALQSCFAVVLGANGVPEAYPPLGNSGLTPREQFLPSGRKWKLGWDAAYCIEDARQLANQIIDNVIPFQGVGGRLLIAHCNDAASLPHLNAAEHVVKSSHNKPLDEAVMDYLFAGHPKQRQIHLRDVFLKRLYSLGVQSTRRLAKALIEKGLVPDTASDHLASAERIVRAHVDGWKKEAAGDPSAASAGNSLSTGAMRREKKSRKSPGI